VVDTGFYAAETPEVHVDAEDVAAAVRYVLQCPPDVDLSTVVVRPRQQLM
jgi:NADP-dependent 3-hydroxy acid dehydrogenase YdfG